MDDPSVDWKDKLTPMAGASWPIRCPHVFSTDELENLRQGLWPQDMDDRWVVWLQGDTLRCWRSWTGACIYEATVFVAADGHGLTPVLNVLDDAETYQRAATDESELERFEGVLSLVRRRDLDTAGA